jgi:uncharacterized RDD family membrane protein YckC
MQTAPSTVVSSPKAGWWVRFFAYFVDSLIVGIPAVIVGFILAALTGGMTSSAGTVNGAAVTLFYLLVLVGPAVYFVYFWSQRDGLTIMNKAMNIKVVKTDGSPITVGTAIVRYIGYILNSIVFGLPIGWLWAAFDADKQGWHDKIAGTYVIRTA